jgi:hypothetical protein
MFTLNGGLVNMIITNGLRWDTSDRLVGSAPSVDRFALIGSGRKFLLAIGGAR